MQEFDEQEKHFDTDTWDIDHDNINTTYNEKTNNILGWFNSIENFAYSPSMYEIFIGF